MAKIDALERARQFYRASTIASVRGRNSKIKIVTALRSQLKLCVDKNDMAEGGAVDG